MKTKISMAGDSITVTTTPTSYLFSPSFARYALCSIPMLIGSCVDISDNASVDSLEDPTSETSNNSGTSTSTGSDSNGMPPTETDAEPESTDLLNRAYVVGLHSGQLTAIDLSDLSIAGEVETGGQANHMAATNFDGTKIYVASSDTDEVVVIDARSLQVQNRIPIAGHPTHISGPSSLGWFGVMAEGTNSVEFIDGNTDHHIASIPGFSTPHFLRFAPDGRFAYVANIGAHHISRVNLETLAIDEHIVLEGFSGPPNADLALDEGGFADVQIDGNGHLYAAHFATNQVLIYDTWKHTKVQELKVGQGPWVVFADRGPSFAAQALSPNRHIVPNFAEASISLIDGSSQSLLGSLPGDENAYGVNYSSLAPNLAFVMNRTRHDVAVVDIQTLEIRKRIAVNGNIETAATSADGQWIVAAVSSANEVVVIDPVSQTLAKRFQNVGSYPWSVTIPRGQTYCH